MQEDMPDFIINFANAYRYVEPEVAYRDHRDNTLPSALCESRIHIHIQ
jgi:hypothetical protein